MTVPVGDPRPPDRMFGVAPGHQPLPPVRTRWTPGQLDHERSPQDTAHHHEFGVVQEDHGISGPVDKLVGVVGRAIENPSAKPPPCG